MALAVVTSILGACGGEPGGEGPLDEPAALGSTGAEVRGGVVYQQAGA